MSIQTGETAEAYVYYRLLTWGYDVHFASGIGRPFDLIVFHGKKSIRIQVKGTSFREEKSPSYQFKTGRGSSSKRAYEECDYDILAMVSLNDERAFFKSEKVNTTYRVSQNKFNAETERHTWEKCLDRATS